MEIHLDSDKLIAFLKDVGEVYAMISGELGDEPAVDRMLNVKNELVGFIQEKIIREKEINDQVEELLTIYEEVSEDNKPELDIEIQKYIDEKNDSDATFVENETEFSLRFLLEHMGFEKAKKFIDVDGD